MYKYILLSLLVPSVASAQSVYQRRDYATYHQVTILRVCIHDVPDDVVLDSARGWTPFCGIFFELVDNEESADIMVHSYSFNRANRWFFTEIAQKVRIGLNSDQTWDDETYRANLEEAFGYALGLAYRPDVKGGLTPENISRVQHLYAKFEMPNIRWDIVWGWLEWYTNLEIPEKKQEYELLP